MVWVSKSFAKSFMFSFTSFAVLPRHAVPFLVQLCHTRASPFTCSSASPDDRKGCEVWLSCLPDVAGLGHHELLRPVYWEARYAAQPFHMELCLSFCSFALPDEAVSLLHQLASSNKAVFLRLQLFLFA